MIKADFCTHHWEGPIDCTNLHDWIKFGRWEFRCVLFQTELEWTRHGNIRFSKYPQYVFHPKTGACLSHTAVLSRGWSGPRFYLRDMIKTSKAHEDTVVETCLHKTKKSAMPFFVEY